MKQQTADAIIEKLKEKLHPDYLVPDDILVTEMTAFLNSLVSEDVNAFQEGVYAEAFAKETDTEIAKRIKEFREKIEIQYRDNPTGCGGSFGELLCWEIHTNEQTFLWLAEKWDISVVFLGEVIADHCNRLDPSPTEER